MHQVSCNSEEVTFQLSLNWYGTRDQAETAPLNISYSQIAPKSRMQPWQCTCMSCACFSYNTYACPYKKAMWAARMQHIPAACVQLTSCTYLAWDKCRISATFIAVARVLNACLMYVACLCAARIWKLCVAHMRAARVWWHVLYIRATYDRCFHIAPILRVLSMHAAHILHTCGICAIWMPVLKIAAMETNGNTCTDRHIMF